MRLQPPHLAGCHCPVQHAPQHYDPQSLSLQRVAAAAERFLRLSVRIAISPAAKLMSDKQDTISKTILP